MPVLPLRASRILCLVSLSTAAPAVLARAQGAPPWRIQGKEAGAHLGSSLATADVNGDGFADLVVGEPDRDGLRAGAGRVSVYHGSPAGLSATPDWTFRGTQAGMRFGARVARVGDVNRDGFDDVLVGAPGRDVLGMPPSSGGGPRAAHYSTDQGGVFLFLGSPAGLEPLPRSSVSGIERGEHFGSAVAAAGDVNGDGFDDMLVGATGKANGLGGVFLFKGRPSGQLLLPIWIYVGTTPGLGLGSAVAPAGDADGDGYDDFVFGLPEKTGCGQFGFVRGGPPSSFGPSTISEGLVAFGPAVDLAGDARPELLFASDGCNGMAPRWRGSVGSGSGSFLSLGAPAAMTAGDMNGDGLLDVIAGMPEFSQGNVHGRVAVYPNRLGHELDPNDAPLVFDSELAGAGWGEALASADVDGDGAAELFVAAPRESGAASEAGSVTEIASWRQSGSIEQVSPPFIGVEFAFSDAVGDFDGDGDSDLVMQATVPFSTPEKFAVRYGSPAGLSAAADALLAFPPLDPAHQQVKVDYSTGDVNGDGFDDLLASIAPEAPFYIFPISHSLYLGSSTGLLPNPAITWTAPGGSGTGAVGKMVGDVNGDGYGDLVIAGALYLGTAGLPASAQALPGDQVFGFYTFQNPVPRNRGVFGGNLDGDPYGDVIIARQTSSGWLTLSAYRGTPAGLSLVQEQQPELLSEQESFYTAFTRVLAFRDLDGDGFDDLLVEYGDTSSSSSGGELALFHGTSSGLSRVTPWWDYSLLDPRFVRRVVLVADVDHDGFQDLLLQDYYSSGTCRLHRGSASGILRTPQFVVTQSTLSLLNVNASGDFDGDGRLEFPDPAADFFSGPQVFEISVP